MKFRSSYKIILISLKNYSLASSFSEISYPLNVRGGENSLLLQQFYDKCLSGDLYLQVEDKKVRQIIRIMLDIADTNKPIVISAPIFLLATLKKQSASLAIRVGGSEWIVSNFPRFLRKTGMTVVAWATVPMIITALPLILTVFIYSGLHIDCNSFVDSLGNLQSIETPIKNDAPVIIDPGTNKPLYYNFDETEVS